MYSINQSFWVLTPKNWGYPFLEQEVRTSDLEGTEAEVKLSFSSVHKPPGERRRCPRKQCLGSTRTWYQIISTDINWFQVISTDNTVRSKTYRYRSTLHHASTSPACLSSWKKHPNLEVFKRTVKFGFVTEDQSDIVQRYKATWDRLTHLTKQVLCSFCWTLSLFSGKMTF